MALCDERSLRKLSYVQLVTLAKNQPNAGKRSVPLLQPASSQPFSLSARRRASSNAELTVSMALCVAFRAGAPVSASPQKGGGAG